MKVVRLADYYPIPEQPIQYPLDFIEKNKSLVLRSTETSLAIGMIDPQDVIVRNELAFFHKKPIEFFQISNQDLSEFLSRRLSDPTTKNELVTDDRMFLDKLANDAPIVNLVNSILMEGIRLNCSDIHIEAYEKKTTVRYRIDGVLQTSRNIEPFTFPGISSRIKVMSNLNIIERRLPQDGRMSVSFGEAQVEFRVSIIPIQDGESIVLRLFQRKGDVKDLDSLEFSANYRDTLRTLARHPNGLILVTGATGSGKTTTLNALLKELNSEKIKIITIEDPVENVIDGIPQVQTNDILGLGFETILRRILRHDPDVIMVGEIRDKETAELAIRAALTGHLVLSTLHTNDALSAISRLINMGVESYLLASVLRGISAQRLVRKICGKCKKEVPLEAEELTLTKNWGVKVPSQWKGLGCPECNNTGFRGRLAIGEIFTIDGKVEDMIVKNVPIAELQAYFQNKKVPLLRDDGWERIRQGLTTFGEIERAVLL